MPATLYKEKSAEDRNGSTKAKGSYRIDSDGNDYSVNVDFSLRKSGIAGTGKGFMELAIFDSNRQQVYRYNKGFTIGAVVGTGTETEKDSESTELMGWDGKGSIVFKVAATDDGSGIPSVKDLEGYLGSVFPQIDLGVPGIKEIGGWIIDVIS